jgi:hypothetical protein
MKLEPCQIVCVAACRDCTTTDCTDRLAGPPQTAEKPKAWAELLDVRKDMEVLRQCGMRTDLSCRHCHEPDCRVRVAPRMF